MPIDPELVRRKKLLEEELDAPIRISRKLAAQNHWLAIILMTVSLGCAALAGLSGLTVFLPLSKAAISILALVPAGISIVASQFKPQARASWHERKLNALRALRARLLYELPVALSADNIAAVSSSCSKALEQMQSEWEKQFEFSWASFSSKPSP